MQIKKPLRNQLAICPWGLPRLKNAPARRTTHRLRIYPHNLGWWNRGPARWTNCIQRGENFGQVDLAFLHRAIIDISLFVRLRLFSSRPDLYCPSVRPVRLEFYDHPFTCPHCSVEILFTSMQQVITSSQRSCPSCKKPILIEDGKVLRLKADMSGKKPPRKARS